MAVEFKLPELGENISAGDVVRVMVSAGDTLAKDQIVLEVETDKAAIEVPASVAGVIAEVKVKPGDKVKPGQTLLTLEETAGKFAPPEAPVPAPVPVSKPAEKNGASETPEPAAAPPPSRAPVPVETASDSGPAAPSVRRFAREIGVEISEVIGSGLGGRVSIEDVKAYSRARAAAAPGSTSAAPPAASAPLPDFSKWGAFERVPMSNVRKATARRMRASWTTVPHVTQNDKCDITEFEEWRKKASKETGVRITVTALLLKVCAAALAKFPQFNASVDESAGEILLKKYRSIGVAVDTDRGLLVPVIRDADKKTLPQLAGELARASEKAREKKLALEDMQGGCFTITNLGGIGGTGFSPIVNWPEVAILGVSRGRVEPVYSPGGFSPRTLMPLSLSYDHRVIDGADAARFLRWVCETVEQPLNLSLEDSL
ncbi:MAG: branched-chain alpha-keto acid dehydrogenase subunit E2 [Elusimicrobia bacterium CG1_02_63_36]|nr:MAG: branched-chain alpha-keto acid dehydrogenase subunit E2 [Elusimicrobia bacterium CG1_02_63_36]PIP83276.1 MAG: branched-chain alpha-keto acid dehydrogenase subunit E2 [Elusimicrobia bacterium CG22_combo_CG10-13_8_21_14_all_63_91]PJA14932.1 MAG: branched-chain alpha-keto acid dehydrogenase subunit E2 [Elusimicrobia bacterium CG_4_10_14_0_2_um_filter_63_34]PJB26013.1 MAG: branched-chain alpha-keto acid dehydrogenase subunit E2 [Elusimicrobia bacterium CG_4_9_14_3_um_filter_62_55]